MEKRKKWKGVRTAVRKALLFVCCRSLSGCAIVGGMLIAGGDDTVPKEEICEYVAGHSEALSAFPYERYESIADDETRAAFLKEALGRDTIVRSVYRYSPSILEFYCGGAGNVTASVYCGFYYSEKDVPYAFAFEGEAQFTQPSDGVYEWESEDHERAFKTERILPKWFWYEQVWL